MPVQEQADNNRKEKISPALTRERHPGLTVSTLSLSRNVKLRVSGDQL